MTCVTFLFVPGDRPERFDKALSSGADLVIIDLEDAVAPDAKEAARAHLEAVLGDAARRVCVRINGADTPWFAKDLGLLKLPGVAAVMLPKAESADVLAMVSAAAVGVPLIPIIETARGLVAAVELARCPNVQQLAFGSVDFQQDLGIEGDGDELLFARSHLVLASRLAGIGAPLDGVTLEVKDAELVERDALRARRLGFGGKLCIHPAQVAPARKAFTPDAASITWANGVLAAVSGNTAGAITYEGLMIDKPVIDRAHRILQRVAAL